MADQSHGKRQETTNKTNRDTLGGRLSLTANNLELINEFHNFFEKASEGDNHHHSHQNHWVFHFIDIIYVATIYNISHLVSYCGEDRDVYVMAASFFVIMFMSRMMFDNFTSIFKATGVLHSLIFLLFGVGVYVMTLNITFQTLSSAPPNGIGVDHTFGACYQQDDYNFGFATGFLFTRFVMFALYGLYYFVFDAQSAVVVTSTSSHHHSSSSVVMKGHSSGSLTSDMSENGEMRPTQQNIRESAISKKTTSYKTGVHGRESITVVRAQDVRTVEEKRIHMQKMFLWKLMPLIISCGVMFALYEDQSPVTILSVVATIEFLGDFLPEFFINLEDMKPNRVHLEERLGLMFMLVLGESMLGLLVQRYNSNLPRNSYKVLLASFFLVATLGMQVFENTHFPHAEMGKHPLDLPMFRSLYVWLNFFMSFTMLVATNGMIGLYYVVAEFGPPAQPNEVHYDMFKISIGLFCVWMTIILLQLLEVNYRNRLIASVSRWFGIESTTNSEEVLEEDNGSVKSGQSELKEIKGVYFNKRILFLKISVAFIHLFSYEYGLEAENFLMIQAVIAAIPNFVEVLLSLIDFVYYMQFIKEQQQQQQQSDVEVEFSDRSRCDGNSVYSSKETVSGKADRGDRAISNIGSITDSEKYEMDTNNKSSGTITATNSSTNGFSNNNIAEVTVSSNDVESSVKTTQEEEVVQSPMSNNQS